MDLNTLTPAPWVYDERAGIASVFAGKPPDCLLSECPRCIASKASAVWSDTYGWMWNPSDLADMEFIAMSRNRLDAQFRRGLYAVPLDDMAKLWVVRLPFPGMPGEFNDEPHHGQFPDPDTAIVEADKWLTAHKDEFDGRR